MPCASTISAKRAFSGRNNRRDVQIAIRRAIGANADRLVGKAHMHSVAVGFGINCHSRNAHFFTGTMNAQRDFSAIRYQNFLKGDGAGHIRR